MKELLDDEIYMMSLVFTFEEIVEKLTGKTIENLVTFEDRTVYILPPGKTKGYKINLENKTIYNEALDKLETF